MKKHASSLAIQGPQAYERALELRYEVYCLECQFLPPEDYPDGVETDEHDERAAHFYAFDHEDELVGYVRLVRPDPTSRFPFQRHCTLTSGIELARPQEAAEISRLMVRKDYRRRQGDGLSGASGPQQGASFSGDRRHQASGVLLNLYRQMYQYCIANDVRFWYAAMEQPLARLLAQFSFRFLPIGPATDYYGPVAPYVADLRSLEKQVRLRDASLLAWLTEPCTRPAAAAPAAPGTRAYRTLPALAGLTVTDWRKHIGQSAQA